MAFIAASPVGAVAQEAPLTLSSPTIALSLFPSDITSAEIMPGYDGLPSVKVRLERGSTVAFSKLTIAMVGQILTIRLCGTILLQPQIMTPLLGGSFDLTGPDLPDVQVIADILSGRADCSSFLP
jgi:preprotein translocase subunit SecD